MRNHEWSYYDPLECEICLWCGFYRAKVEGTPCRGHPGACTAHNPVMETLLQSLRDKRTDCPNDKR